MKATLTYLGRLVSLAPAALGEQFKEIATVHAVRKEAASAENGWKEQTVPDISVLWWEDTTPQGEPVFCVPSGYGYRVYHTLVEQGHEVVVRDFVPSGLPDRPDFSRLSANIEWRGSQMTVLSKLLANRCGVVDCPTGWGKSFIIQQVVRVYPKAKIAVTVPSIEIANEIYNGLLGVLGPSEVGIVGDGKRKKRRVNVAVTHSLLKLDPDTSLILVDEVHAVLTKNFLRMFGKFHRARLQGFTATPTGRSDQGDGFLEAYFGPILHHVPYQEAVESGNIVQIHYRVYQCPWGPKTAGMTKIKRDRNGIWRNPMRNALIVQSARDAEAEYGPDGQILIMVSTAEHGFLLQQHLTDYVVVTGEMSEEREAELRENGTMTETQIGLDRRGREDVKAKFSSGEIKRAIATYVWSKGVNFLDLAVLIRADGTAAEIASGQVPGRLSRKGSDGAKPYGLLVDFNDSFCPVLAKRSRDRFAVYNRNGWPYEPGG
jgi:superfamily II DNA or RNA helicase